MKRDRIRTGMELLEKLNETLDAYDRGEATFEKVQVHTKIVDSMCKLVKVTNDTSRDLLRFDGAVESLRPFVQTQIGNKE